MSQFFASGGQSIGASASASVLPMNIQGGFPLELTAYMTAIVAAKSHQSCPTLCNPIDWTMQPTRLRRPWNSPGKNTGVGCHFLLQYMKVKSESEVAQSFPTPSDPMDYSLPGSSVHEIFQAGVLECVYTYTAMCQIASGKLLYSTGSSAL